MGNALRAGMVEAVAEDLDQGGFRAVEITGSSLFECSVRYSREDPWEGLDLWRRWMPNSELRSPVCQNRIGIFGMTPDSLMDLWVQTLIKHGINSFWVYDCLYNMDEMRRLCRTIDEAGGQALGAIMYGISFVRHWGARERHTRRGDHLPDGQVRYTAGARGRERARQGARVGTRAAFRGLGAPAAVAGGAAGAVRRPAHQRPDRPRPHPQTTATRADRRFRPEPDPAKDGSRREWRSRCELTERRMSPASA